MAHMWLSLPLHPGRFVSRTDASVRGRCRRLVCRRAAGCYFVVRNVSSAGGDRSLLQHPRVSLPLHIATGRTVPWFCYPIRCRSWGIMAGCIKYSTKKQKEQSVFPSFFSPAQSDVVSPFLTVATPGGQQQELHISSPPAGGQNGRTT